MSIVTPAEAPERGPDLHTGATGSPGLTASFRRSRRQPRASVVLLVASFGAFLAFLDSTIVNVAFPDIQRSFPDSALSSLSWVLNAYNIVLAAFLVAAGRMADLLGRKRLFVVGVVVFTVASALCAVAGTVEQLIAFRVLQGFGAALLIPASLALVVEAFDVSQRAHGVGLWGAAAAIASGLGPPAGGALVALESWRLAFLVNVPLGIAAVVLARRCLVESRSPGVRRMPDLLGALLLAARSAPDDRPRPGPRVGVERRARGRRACSSARWPPPASCSARAGTARRCWTPRCCGSAPSPSATP
jgi:MFS family permease